MKTYVTVNFKYDNKEYLFYGENRNEVKEKIDNWMKENNITYRPHYNYNDFDTLINTDEGLKNKVHKMTDCQIWNNEYNENWDNFLYKNLVRMGGFLITFIILVVILYEVRKYMLYPYFVEFVNNRPENLIDGLDKVMNFGWDVMGIMILFYWKTEITLIISTIIGWFTPKFIEMYLYKKNMKKMKEYKNNLVIL